LESRREARDDAQSDLELARTQAEFAQIGSGDQPTGATPTETKATMRLLVAEAEAAITKTQAMFECYGPGEPSYQSVPLSGVRHRNEER